LYLFSQELQRIAIKLFGEQVQLLGLPANLPQAAASSVTQCSQVSSATASWARMY